jgi:hypothetical protein
MKQVERAAQQRIARMLFLGLKEFQMRIGTQLDQGQVRQSDGGAAAVLGPDLVAGMEPAVWWLGRGQVPYLLAGARYFDRALDQDDLNWVRGLDGRLDTRG